jgi:hypothetical protein
VSLRDFFLYAGVAAVNAPSPRNQPTALHTTDVLGAAPFCTFKLDEPSKIALEVPHHFALDAGISMYADG